MPEEKKNKKPTALNTVTGRSKSSARPASKPTETAAHEQTQPAVEAPKRLARAPKPATPKLKQPAAPRAARKRAERAVSPVSAASTESTTGQKDTLSIVMVTPEAHPFAKTGGLAEVAGALPDALANLGHSVTIVLPRYRGIAVDSSDAQKFTVRLGSHEQAVSVYEVALRPGILAALVDAPELFDREGLYGTPSGDYPDNAWRFAVFSRAALEYVRLRGTRPSIIHAHDWQSGLVPVYQKMHFSEDPIVGGVPVVFTIHNLAFQGMFSSDILPHLGLGWEVLNMQAMEHWGRISFLKAGINFSEKITTVSPTYAREILRPELGFGFDGVLARRVTDLVGILNGIDTRRWNPEHDEFVPASFSAENLTAKRDAKRALLEAVGFSTDESTMQRPLVGIVSRLTDQKGFDLIAAAAEPLMKLDATWVMLGSGDKVYEDLLKSLAARFPDRVSTTIGFDERLAHLIEAGADMFLMPSRFEPCGLNQMYSLRYGTVPVVRATGGLEDTVLDVDEAKGTGTGFKFVEYAPWALLGAMERALTASRDPDVWRRIQEAGMRRDCSWDASAREYVKVYRAILRAQAGAGSQ
jgi:starch synthase